MFSLALRIVTICLCISVFHLVESSPSSSHNLYSLRIFHLNDVHAHYAPFLSSGVTCTLDEEGVAGKCRGGLARARSLYLSKRSEAILRGEDTLFLHAGDEFQGTLFFTLYGPNISAIMVNAMGYDAMAIGNHEFDRGPDAFGRYVEDVHPSTAIVCSNLQVRYSGSVPLIERLLETRRIQPYVIRILPSGKRVAIIGVTTRFMHDLSSPGEDLIFDFPTEIVAQLVPRVRREENASIVLVLSHRGYQSDISMAQRISGIDAIVGGHSHTYLGPNSTAGPYPTFVTSPSGSFVCIVQAASWSMYLGDLLLSFSSTGVLQQCSGSPLQIVDSILPDPTVEALVDSYRGRVTELMQQAIGWSTIFLDGHSCRSEECSLGDLAADAARFRTRADIAIINGGGVRASILAGSITYGAVYEAFPFGNSLMGADVPGSFLREVFRFGVEDAHGWGGFLQFSGVEVEVEEHPVRKLKNIWVVRNHTESGRRAREPLIDSRMYRFVTISFLWRGGDGFKMLKNVSESGQYTLFDYGYTMAETLLNYVREFTNSNRPIHVDVGNRISVFKSPPPSSPSTSEDRPLSILITVLVFGMSAVGISLFVVWKMVRSSSISSLLSSSRIDSNQVSADLALPQHIRLDERDDHV